MLCFDQSHAKIDTRNDTRRELVGEKAQMPPFDTELTQFALTPEKPHFQDGNWLTPSWKLKMSFKIRRFHACERDVYSPLHVLESRGNEPLLCAGRVKGLKYPYRLPWNNLTRQDMSRVLHCVLAEYAYISGQLSPNYISPVCLTQFIPFVMESGVESTDAIHPPPLLDFAPLPIYSPVSCSHFLFCNSTIYLFILKQDNFY